MNYMAKAKDGELLSFYYSNGKLSYKTWQGSEFSEEIAVISNILDNFTINLSYDDTVYIFCQAKNGDIILCTKKGTAIQTRTILENHAPTVYKVKFSALSSESGLTLIYNSPTHIIMQRLDKGGSWRQPVNIDRYISLPDSIYITQSLSPEHMILFYMTSENYLAYRELNSEVYGNANIFYSVLGEVGDLSFLATENSLHMLFIIKNMFSQQVLYRKKDSSEFSSIRVVWEAQKIDGCLLFEAGKTLYLTFNMNGQLYIMSSADNGATFSRISKYKENFSMAIKKSSYVSSAPDEPYSLNDIYVSRNDPSNLKLIQEFCPRFFPAAVTHPAPTVQPVLPAVSNSTPVSAASMPSSNRNEVSNPMTEAFNRLQSQYNLAVQQNGEKERQLQHYKSQAEIHLSEVNSLKLEIVKLERELTQREQALQIAAAAQISQSAPHTQSEYMISAAEVQEEKQE